MFFLNYISQKKMTTKKKIGKISLNGEWNLKNEARSINIPA